MKHLIYILISLFSFQVMGQLTFKEELAIDSLKISINTAQHDTIKINAYTAWDNIIYVSNPKLDLELNLKIIDLAQANLKKELLSDSEKKAFKKSLALAFNSVGIIFYNKGDYDKAINYYSRSLKIREEIHDKKGLAATLNNLGIVYQDQGDNAKAIEYYTLSLMKNEENGDKEGKANNLSNIGRLYREQHDTAKAIVYFTSSLKISEEIDDKRGVAIAYSNIGSIYSDQGNKLKAMEYFTRYLTVSEEIGDENNIALALGNIGFIYKNLDNNFKALDYLNRSLKMFKEIGNKKWVATLLTYIGDIYKKNGEIAKATEFYKNALAIAQGAGLVTATEDASQALSNSYKILGNYKEALKMHELYIMMRDSIINENSQKAIMKQEIRYSYDKQKALDAKEYEKQKAVSAEREQKQKVISYAIAGSLVLVLVFTFFVFNRLRFTAKQKKIIEEQKNLVEGKQKEISDSVSYAKRIQTSFLTSEVYIKRYLPEYFILYKPRDIVSGDFYWMHQQKDYLYFCVADCTGHGIPGAFMSLIGMGILNEIIYSKQIKDTNKILDELRRIVILAVNPEGASEEGKDGMDMVLGRLHCETKELQYSAANNSFYVYQNGELIKHKPDKMPVGKLADFEKPFSQHTIQLKTGDIIYASTDGFLDQFGGSKGKKFMSRRFESYISSITDKPLDEQKEMLDNEFMQWKGELGQVDDVCLIGVKI